LMTAPSGPRWSFRRQAGQTEPVPGCHAAAGQKHRRQSTEPLFHRPCPSLPRPWPKAPCRGLHRARASCRQRPWGAPLCLNPAHPATERHKTFFVPKNTPCTGVCWAFLC
jgi:hypothetical protein